jgi:uncharacterized iron-regulated membrane protein
MTTQLTSAQPTPTPSRNAGPGSAGSGWFRAFWRWHFYAAFLVAPVLLILAITGVIYLFRFQLEPLIHADLMQVSAPSAEAIHQPYANQLAAVAREFPDGQVVSMTEPRAEGRSTTFSLTLPDGSTRDVFVSPYGAEVLGSLDPDRTLSGYAVRLHGDLMTGTWGERLIELAACWAIVMAITGYYLFWRGRRARSRQPGSLRSRHAQVGAVAGVGLLFLLVSGLPWTGFWGEQAQSLAVSQGTSFWSLDHGAISDPSSTLDESLPHSHADDVPWAQGEWPVPRSGRPTGESGERSVADVDTAVAVAAEAGLRHPMTVALPAVDDGVFSVIGFAFEAPSDERTVHVDQYGGGVVSTYGFKDYPVLAKVIAHGIGLHEGRTFGPWSMAGSTLMCALVVASCLTGPVMWWKRRPSGSLGAPRGRMPLRATPAMLVGLVALGMFLPFFGGSLLVVLLLDQLVIRRVPGLAAQLNAS